MNKFTFAVCSTLMGILFAIIMVLNFTAKFIAGTITILVLIATIIKLLVLVSAKSLSDMLGLHKIQLLAGDRHPIEYA